MNPDHFVKIFDIVESGFREWSFSAFGLLFVAAGIVGVLNPSLMPTRNQFLDSRPILRKYFYYVILAFSVVWTVSAFVSTYSNHVRLKSIAMENRCRVVEGPVERLEPMPRSGHGAETFSVKDVPFRLSDSNVNGGFNTTSLAGGPIKADSYVRICYAPDNNIILRLEIAEAKPPGQPSAANTR